MTKSLLAPEAVWISPRAPPCAAVFYLLRFVGRCALFYRRLNGSTLPAVVTRCKTLATYVNAVAGFYCLLFFSVSSYPAYDGLFLRHRNIKILEKPITHCRSFTEGKGEKKKGWNLQSSSLCWVGGAVTYSLPWKVGVGVLTRETWGTPHLRASLWGLMQGRALWCACLEKALDNPVWNKVENCFQNTREPQLKLRVNPA